jgi:hypothetical protein
MGLNDRDYMRASAPQRNRSSRRPAGPTLAQRLKFWLWRLLRIKRGT